ncbi:universal stress protein family [Colletotrichum scovillei]|uniref:Universal stress protein family n=7 Tax=Colletotrichum acutatum species complex TaxID=2707335 RepID=A0A9P7QYB1_9PEZI|nr:universal stress protein family [Colletotrichum scovillei]XP_049152462.1 universal stress protein family [Colletotrichum lupini]XP_060396211.1 universal stress protein family [Colletotrichum abscissum]KAK0368604.1 universal stress protein family [Colletotrichum limetticola]KAK1448814.1 universal stress protein family [Colletotrichum melonis]KXH37759.1 universal stress protein family [Colletotrichum nymphaeae SA-01]KXH52712.1 universal stress protein family [Colletotrichum simmondsii]KAF47
MSHQPMSMEAMLDEERRDVLALLEGTAARSNWNTGSPVSARSPSPYTTPRSPVRSMLDIGADGGSKSPRLGNAVPVRSMLDISGPPAPVRSMLDINTSAPKQAASAGPSSPVESRAPHPRTFSDSHSQKPSFGPRAPINRMDPTLDYQFSDISTNNIGTAMPKRNTQGKALGVKKPGGGAMVDVMRGNEIPGIILPGDRARHGSIASNPVMGGRSSSRGQGSKSKSPHGRLSMRSRSPNVSGRLQQIPGTAILDDGRVVDISTAYRKLSDANLAFSGGGLSGLAGRKKSSADDAGLGRLTKDYLSPDGEELEDSSDDDAHSSSDEENERGRKMSPRDEESNAKSGSSADKGDRKTLSLLAAAEEERLAVSSKQPQYKYKSLLDEPSITLTKPGGEKSKSKAGIRPTTAFDNEPGSGMASAVNSDDEEELNDIKRAQRLAFSRTETLNNPEFSRTLRIIMRGEFDQIQKSAEEEHHRLRKYLVATDLSEESTHALEWTIGTVLRDGDTLICIYCVDEETGIYSTEGIMVPDERAAHQEQAAAINAMSSAKSPPPNMTSAPPFPHLPRASALNNSDSSSPAPSSRERGRAEEERRRAVNDIQERVERLLRRTRLQVRVIVEVIHCKNPKHLITEVIDIVSPTLVILGSRGRSALKGVILGSFSNYLVTKSSVPVMVARKRLRNKSKYKRGPLKQVNDLNNPGTKSLANAKVD